MTNNIPLSPSYTKRLRHDFGRAFGMLLRISGGVLLNAAFLIRNFYEMANLHELITRLLDVRSLEDQ